MTKEFRKQFRQPLYVQNIHQLTEYDSAYDYKNVIFTYRNKPGRIDKYLDLGWEIVESTDHLKDDRSFTPNSKKEKLRPQEIITTTTDGHKQVLMRIPKKLREENRTKLMEADHAARVAEAERRGDKVKKVGNQVKTVGKELNG